MQDQYTIEGYHLSQQQIRLWLVQEDSTAYRAHCSITLVGLLNVNKLREALEQAISHHEIDRTCFRCLPGMKVPLQVVTEGSFFTWQQVNLRDHSPEEQQQLLKEVAEEQRGRIIELACGPLLHFSLVSISDRKHILLLDLPALHADNRSLENLMGTMAQYYGGDRLSEEDVPQYLQFCAWQQALLDEEEESRTGREYWGRLDFSHLTGWSLPYEDKSHNAEDFLPACFAVPTANDCYARLSLLSEHYSTSAANFFLACWHILLWRLTGQERTLVAVGLDGRSFEEMAQIAGPLTIALPIGCRLSDNQRFSEILAQVKQKTGEARKWQHYWTGAVGTDSLRNNGSRGDAMGGPLFPFSFDASYWPAASVVDGVSFSLQECYTYQEPFKIKVCVLQKDDHTLILEFHYDTSLFSFEDMERIADQYHTLIQSALSQPEVLLCELAILSEKARTDLLVALNAKSHFQPTSDWVTDRMEQRFHHMFEQQVEQTPDAIAVAIEETYVSYRQLNVRANQLAHFLQRTGVGPDVAVGIYIEPSLEMVVGLLGILKAGGAYVPLDPSAPVARLALLLEEIQPPLVLTQAHLVARLSSLWRNPTSETFCLDAHWHRLLGQPCTNAANVVQPCNLAYVIYTSGSTGLPKGVMITQQGLANYLDFSRQYYQMERGYGSIVHSSLTFDLTITSLFLPLVSGRTTILVPEGQGIEGLVAVLRRYPCLSVLKVTPTHLEMLNQMLTYTADLWGGIPNLIG